MAIRVGRSHFLNPRPATTYPVPGTVGYRGNVGDLTVIDRTHPYTGTGGSTWVSDQGNTFTQTNLTLDHVWVKESLYWRGTGTLTITNSILEGGNGFPYTVWADASSATTINVTDTTLGYPSAFPNNSDSANIAGRDRYAQNLTRCDISGQPHGMEFVADSSATSCYVHDLWWNPVTDPHLDGLFVFGGAVQVINNNFDCFSVNNEHGTAAIFMQDLFGWGIPSPVIHGNFLAGGAFSFFNQSGTNCDVQDNVFGGFLFGDATNDNVGIGGPPTIAVWSNNRRVNGTLVPNPA